jgi:hypothetical protein
MRYAECRISQFTVSPDPRTLQRWLVWVCLTPDRSWSRRTECDARLRKRWRRPRFLAAQRLCPLWPCRVLAQARCWIRQPAWLSRSGLGSETGCGLSVHALAGPGPRCGPSADPLAGPEPNCAASGRPRYPALGSETSCGPSGHALAGPETSCGPYAGTETSCGPFAGSEMSCGTAPIISALLRGSASFEAFSPS